MNPSTLIVLPCYNESQNIEQLLTILFDQYDFVEVVVVDDSSPDGTAGVVRKLQEQFPERLHLLVREGKNGRGSAVMAGFRFAQERDYEYVLEMDADCSHDPKYIPDFLEKMTDHDLVIGSRYQKGGKVLGWNWKRKIISRCANIYERILLGMPITDYTNGYRCYSRRALAALNHDQVQANGYIVLSEIAYQLYKKGMKLTDIPTVFVNRQRGKSNLTVGEITEALLSVLRLKFRKFDVPNEDKEG